ncbi:MAG: hypothetical protein UR43_C0013G0015 [candidate division TM6 bacterium GW2011_GWF2_33_332]|nr:MAG: hypothetical protein UR43_C0013G0015 [candidate division TM6 bacterium GW2011_GWF2_33_332]
MKMLNEITLIMAKKDDLWGVINLKGETVVNFEFKEVTVHEDFDLIQVENESGVGFYDTNGKKLVPCSYKDSKRPFGYNHIPVLNEFWGLIDRNGNYIIKDNYLDIEGFINRNMIFLKNVEKKWGAVNVNLNLIIPFVYDDIRIVW